jgi:hypothetical protein
VLIGTFERSPSIFPHFKALIRRKLIKSDSLLLRISLSSFVLNVSMQEALKNPIISDRTRRRKPSKASSLLAHYVGNSKENSIFLSFQAALLWFSF